MSSFVFIGGAAAIDFLNTEVIREGERVDLLEEPEDLLRWLRSAGVSPASAGAGGTAALQKAKELRAAARELFLKLARGGRPRKSDIEPINAALRRGKGSFRVELEKGQVHTHFAPDAADPLFLLASAIAEFLQTADPSLIKSCEGDGCILLFYDQTKNHTRRWCSMAGCGNRMKAALHYRRLKDSAADSPADTS